MEKILTKHLLHTLFKYKDGNLFWKIKPCKNIAIGKKAGSLDKDGYVTVRYNKKSYKAHRLIFMMHYGYMPLFLDHIDRDPSNNKVENLREVSHSENLQNKGMYKTNKSGYKYIQWFKKTNSWRLVYKKNHIGYYKQLEDAVNTLERLK